MNYEEKNRRRRAGRAVGSPGARRTARRLRRLTGGAFGHLRQVALSRVPDYPDDRRRKADEQAAEQAAIAWNARVPGTTGTPIHG